MTKTSCCLLLAVIAVASAAAQMSPASQPVLWASKPDAAAFEKTINDHLAAAQKSIDVVVAVKGPRTISNTLGPFDEAIRQINTASYFAGLMQQVHPEAAFRDKATALYTRPAGLVRRCP